MIQAFYIDRCHFCPSPESSKVICRSIQRKVKDFFSFFTCSMSVRYANTFIYTPAHGGRAGHLRDRPPVLVRFYGTPLPDASGQCRGTANHDDCPPPPLHRSDRAP